MSRLVPGVPLPLSAVEELRGALAERVRMFVAGDDVADVEDFLEPSGDPGLFGPDSVAWRVHADPSMFVGGLRALLVQTMHPLAMAGVAEHSDYKRNSLGRLNRTAGFIGTTTYGSTRAAELAIRRVRRVHVHVQGAAPDGRHYEANDPALLRWVHSAEVDSFLKAYQRFGRGRLTGGEANRYLTETARVAIALGADDVPMTTTEMRVYFRDVRPELHAGPQARETARWLCVPPLPIAARPAYSVLIAAAIGMLPARTRRSLHLLQPPLAQTMVVRPAAQILIGTLGWVMGDGSPLLDAARERAATPVV